MHTLQDTIKASVHTCYKADWLGISSDQFMQFSFIFSLDHIGLSITITGCSHGFTCLPCHCKYLHGIFWTLSHSSSPTLIKWWFRYVDDVHSATRKIKSTNFKSISIPWIHTSNLPYNSQEHMDLPFLDTITKPTPNSIESTVYRKPTHTDRYLDYNSNHPISAKLSVVHTLIHRAKQVCSTPKFLAKEWITSTESYKTTTTQHSSFNKANTNRKSIKSQTHPQ